MGLRDLKAWLALGGQLSRARKALEKEAKVEGYDVKITAAKAGRALLAGALSVCGAALVGYLTDSAAMAAALREAGLSDALTAALVPALLAIGAGLRNGLKNVTRI